MYSSAIALPTQLIKSLQSIRNQVLFSLYSNDRWLWQVHSHLERAIVIHSLNVEIPLTEIYRRVNF
ncbi:MULTISPECIES: hypothetical protein [Nostoc]|uniref:hypothetical protein n=1 Tax=Nostoc TaxID=1177 RepID=UPI001F54A926|nr:MULTISPECIES: hypothetical protein [Nostoc]